MKRELSEALTAKDRERIAFAKGYCAEEREYLKRELAEAQENAREEAHISASHRMAIAALQEKVNRLTRERNEARKELVTANPEPPYHRCGEGRIRIYTVTPDDPFRAPYYEIRCRDCGQTAQGVTLFTTVRSWFQYDAEAQEEEE